MKKILSILLALCLLFGTLPTQALAYVGDIVPTDSTKVETSTKNGTLVLQNDYIRVTVNKQDGIVTTAPAAASDGRDRQKPFCEFVTWKGYGYNKQELVYPADLRLKNASFVDKTPNGKEKAIKVEYDLTAKLPGSTLTATTAVYYELVQRKDNGSSADAWGVLTTVSSIYITGGYVPPTTDSDAYAPRWGYTLDGFTGMGHANATDGPAIKMNRTVYNTDQNTKSTESSVLTGKVENLSTWTSFFQGNDYCGVDIGEIYVDGYTWANPFVGLQQASDAEGINVTLPDTVSVTPGSNPAATRVECKGGANYHFNSNEPGGNVHFLWGFRDLTKNTADIPSNPDKVKISINAKRLAAFADGTGVRVEYIADDAALKALTKQYGTPVALISGDYESKNGEDFTFTGGAAQLSPSVTATWDKASGGKLIIHKNGTIEHSGVSLNAPSFKFYRPRNSAENDLKISLTKDGFAFEINPEKNEAIVYVDIPYATVNLEKAAADAAGNLVFSGEIGFRTVFNGAEFSLKKLGYGLNEKNEFKVNGVHATGSFDTAKLMALELASVEGEVNTFKGEERYAFSLELNAFDLFETEAELALTRSKTDGSLIPDELWFYVKADPGIPLIPPIPIGQLNGGGAGFKDLADTVNGDYFAIPPLKLRGALTGTYLHLIQGTGNVVLGPSEISLKATDVGIVGLGESAQIIDSFGYSLYLNGQERTYKGTTYKGIYFGGSEELALNLPSKTIDIIALETAIKLGAFGGVDDAKENLYLGVGANGIVNGRVQIPSYIPLIGGLKLVSTDINLIVGGQTTAPIKGVSVSEGMKQAFNNVDVYLGAMAQVGGWLASGRVWVLVPQIVETDFRKGGGWDIEVTAFGYLPEWDWTEKGVEPVVHSTPAEDGEENTIALYAKDFPALLNGGENTQTITVTAGTDETPYILLAFDNTVTEEQIEDALSIKKKGENENISINWVGEDGQINSNAAINAATDIIKNKDDGKSYRVAMLRLTEGGTYEVGTGLLELVTEKSKGFAVTPFEELELNLNESQVSGKIKYAEEKTKYVLRTYLANEEGGADYLIDEREVEDAESISVAIPDKGALAPTGEYYVTAFLMTEKSLQSTNESGESETVTGLAAIDSRQFDTKVNYTNSNQPNAPTNVTLEATGNEVMTADWDKVDGADGYAVTIYQQDGNDWINTGFGYDLDAQSTSIDMALTVGGEETTESKNLSADKTYKVGVRAYKKDAESEGAKYYSAETESSGVYLPEYKPLNMTLSVNETECTQDENGVYHAYVDGDADVLKVSSATEGVTFKVTRMDKDTDNEIQADDKGAYMIPDFEGSLMFKIDGISNVENSTAKDVTSVFLLVSVDKTAPVLTLSAPIFYADPDSGEYTITGTADAGSQIFYQGNEGTKSVYAAGDGSFAISGMLETDKNSSGVLSLYAQDSAGNKSASQAALITKQKQPSEPEGSGGSSGGSSGSSYSDYTIQASANAHGSISPSGSVKVREGADQTFTITPDNGYTVADVKVDGKSIGAVSTYTFEKVKGSHSIEAEFAPEDGIKQAKVKELTKSILLTARSVKTAKKNVKVTLKMNEESAAAIKELQALGYTVKYKFYRSEKKARRYKAALTKSSKVYVNTQGEKGRRYYYKARVMVYDQSGRFVAGSKLTQCKYAARIWTK